MGRKVRLMGKESQSRVADISGFAEESLNAIRTLSGIGVRNLMSRSVLRLILMRHWSRRRGEFACVSALTALVITLVFGAVVFSSLVLAEKNVLAGRISTGQLSSFVFYSVVVASSAGAISEVWGRSSEGSGCC